MGYGNGGGVGSAAYAEGAALKVTAGTAVSQRIPMVMDELAGTEKRLEVLHNALSELECRLDHVTRAETPAQAGDKLSQPHPGVQLGLTVMQNNGRIDHAIQRVQSLLSRLEI